ncbi:hypothetical protein TSAR_000768 [Trichomalopsis sarcophagae]|uniref:Uncharacterized protein n=1 Tax=Trichomalopsis sarcophagae TaxID=543379 RepID=A0A232EJA7_9HYME|nr:hypothetical protein TSAR_000768 [Trichomalopsis sarcophagae]
MLDISNPTMRAGITNSCERDVNFDAGRNFNTSSFLNVSDFSEASHSSAVAADLNATFPTPRQPDLAMALSLPQNWQTLSLDDKIGELFTQITAGNNQINLKLDALMIKVDDHDKRITALEQDTSANLKVSGIPSTCTLSSAELVQKIFVKLNMSVVFVILTILDAQTVLTTRSHKHSVCAPHKHA